MLHVQENSGKVDANNSFKIRLVIVDDSPFIIATYASTADHNVKFSEIRHSSVDSILDILFVCNITVNINGVA